MAERDYGAMSRADLVSLVKHLEERHTRHQELLTALTEENRATKAGMVPEAESHIPTRVLRSLNVNMGRVKERHAPHVDANHTYGVLAEEMAELLDAIRVDHAANQRAELIDIATAALRGVEALDARESGRGRG